MLEVHGWPSPQSGSHTSHCAWRAAGTSRLHTLVGDEVYKGRGAERSAAVAPSRSTPVLSPTVARNVFVTSVPPAQSALREGSRRLVTPASIAGVPKNVSASMDMRSPTDTDTPASMKHDAILVASMRGWKLRVGVTPPASCPSAYLSLTFRPPTATADTSATAAPPLAMDNP